MKHFHPSKLLEKICLHCGKPGIKWWHRFNYYRLRGRWPNFDSPQDLSERLLSQMHKPEWLRYAYYADKWKVRKYIESKGLKSILLDVYGVWENANDIDFYTLPDKFALKPNNGSGGHFLCHDKSKINEAEVRKQLNWALDMIDENPAFHWEPHYAAIERRIYAEELIDVGEGKMPMDYKFTCVNGKVVDCFICSERETGHTKYITLDTDWKVLPYTKSEYLPTTVPEKPKYLKEMLEIAEILSADFECVRIDLYEYKDQVFFSELTFSPWGGMMYSYNDEGIKAIGEKFNEKQ